MVIRNIWVNFVLIQHESWLKKWWIYSDSVSLSDSWMQRLWHEFSTNKTDWLNAKSNREVINLWIFGIVLTCNWFTDVRKFVQLHMKMPSLNFFAIQFSSGTERKENLIGFLPYTIFLFFLENMVYFLCNLCVLDMHEWQQWRLAAGVMKGGKLSYSHRSKHLKMLLLFKSDENNHHLHTQPFIMSFY
jgi:hypothetical protein